MSTKAATSAAVCCWATGYVVSRVRNDDQADSVAARGATPPVVDLHDRPRVMSLLRDADSQSW
jgi:hypothetical protein